MNRLRTSFRSSLLLVLLNLFSLSPQPGQSGTGLPDTFEPPLIPIGYDAFVRWEQWPVLRLGVRAYLKSTFDRTGGNHFADVAHYLRQLDDQHSVALNKA